MDTVIDVARHLPRLLHLLGLPARPADKSLEMLGFSEARLASKGLDVCRFEELRNLANGDRRPIDEYMP